VAPGSASQARPAPSITPKGANPLARNVGFPRLDAGKPDVPGGADGVNSETLPGRTLPSRARLVGSYETLPAANKAEIQRILNTEARRYAKSNREPESAGARR
jgi:hypothetical protein